MVRGGWKNSAFWMMTEVGMFLGGLQAQAVSNREGTDSLPYRLISEAEFQKLAQAPWSRVDFEEEPPPQKRVYAKRVVVLGTSPFSGRLYDPAKLSPNLKNSEAYVQEIEFYEYKVEGVVLRDEIPDSMDAYREVYSFGGYWTNPNTGRRYIGFWRALELLPARFGPPVLNPTLFLFYKGREVMRIWTVASTQIMSSLEIVMSPDRRYLGFVVGTFHGGGWQPAEISFSIYALDKDPIYPIWIMLAPQLSPLLYGDPASSPFCSFTYDYDAITLWSTRHSPTTFIMKVEFTKSCDGGEEQKEVKYILFELK